MADNRFLTGAVGKTKKLQKLGLSIKILEQILFRNMDEGLRSFMMKSLGKTSKKDVVLYGVVLLSVLLGFLGLYDAGRPSGKYESDLSYFEEVASFFVPCFVVQYVLVILGWLYNRFIQKDESRKFVFFYRFGKWFRILNIVIVGFVFFAITMSYSDGPEAYGRNFWEFSRELYYWEIIVPWVASAYMLLFYIEGILVFLWKRLRMLFAEKN